MRYWKRIQLQYEEEIRQRTIELITKHSKILEPKEFKGSFIPMPPEFLAHNPYINKSLEPYGKTCIEAAVYLMWNNLDGIPHIDYPYNKLNNTIVDNPSELKKIFARINIPLLNCKNTYTVFYENVETRLLTLPTGAMYYAVINNDYYEVSRVEINSATIIRISSAHAIMMDETNAPRLTLTLTIDSDVVDLLDQDNDEISISSTQNSIPC